MYKENKLYLNLAKQKLDRDLKGYKVWNRTVHQQVFITNETAILICDMWNRHWCSGAEERGKIIAVEINKVIKRARENDVTIIHSPSDTMDFYAGTRARERILEVPAVEPPKPLNFPDNRLPLDASDRGSDTDETVADERIVWSSQNPVIEINDSVDVISENGNEIYSYLVSKKIKNLIMMGVHTNMCIFYRSFGIRQMVRWGVNTVLVRDLTDTMYNPAMPPYVNHDVGTGLMVDYIEKFWCPSVFSSDLLK